MSMKKYQPAFLIKLLTVVLGFFALIWFLVRVIPKPSRASYPCQRAAFPIASGFVIWLTGIITSSFLFKASKFFFRRSKWKIAYSLMAIGLLAGLIALRNTPESIAIADLPIPNSPVGTAQGIYPGRVAWVHDANATDWAGEGSDDTWYERTDTQTVENMMSLAIRSIAGQPSEQGAWNEIFKYFNNNNGKGNIGYQSGEKIMIKLNLTTCSERNGTVNKTTYDKTGMEDNIDNSPQMVRALLRQLVNIVGVEPNKISVGDPTAMVPNYYWNMLHTEFPDVNYIDNYGELGRTRSEFSTTRIYWSTPDANGKLPDYLPVCFADADYIINFAILKSHGAGVTLCGKNHYGSVLRCPDGYMRDVRYLYQDDYYNMHNSLPFADAGKGTGKYRSLVDLMGHENLGGKTVLYLIDGLFGGYNWDSQPYLWVMEPFGDGVTGDWPNSLFVSLDPVAIDSVGYDFVAEQYPDQVLSENIQGGADDYLQEAAQANSPPSGSFYDPENDGTVMESLGVNEHWNNSIDKQYSRNLGNGNGIELIKLPSNSKADFDLDNRVNFRDFAALAAGWQKEFGDTGYNPVLDVNLPNNIINETDLGLLADDWLK